MIAKRVQRSVDRVLDECAEDADALEVLNHIKAHAELKIANLQLRNRLSQDIFQLFTPTAGILQRSINQRLNGRGQRLLESCSVVSYEQARTCDQYRVAAVVRFDCVSLRVGSKRSRMKCSIDESCPSAVDMKFVYDELMLHSASAAGGDGEQSSTNDSGNPQKSITLTVQISHPCGATVDLIAFQLWAAGCSPSRKQQMVISGIPEGCSDTDRADSPPVDDAAINVGTNEDNEDVDFYSVYLEATAFHNLNTWLCFTGAEDGCYDGSINEELLMFVLSFPYVDEAWGVHDLILVRWLRCPCLSVGLQAFVWWIS